MFTINKIGIGIVNRCVKQNSGHLFIVFLFYKIDKKYENMMWKRNQIEHIFGVQIKT